MLDFYLISDSEGIPKPDKLGNLNYAGGLDLDVYARLVRKGIIDSRYDYYSDFRWENELVKKIESKAKDFSADTDFMKLKGIIDKALNKEIGLIAFGD